MSAAPSPSYRTPEPVPTVLRSAPPDHRTRPDRDLLDTCGPDGPEHNDNGLHTMKAVLVVTLED
jgi:hypothetical protein